LPTRHGDVRGLDQHLTGLCAEIGRILGSMLNNPTPFLVKPER
jgi:hypothetical protein